MGRCVRACVCACVSCVCSCMLCVCVCVSPLTYPQYDTSKDSIAPALPSPSREVRCGLCAHRNTRRPRSAATPCAQHTHTHKPAHSPLHTVSIPFTPHGYPHGRLQVAWLPVSVASPCTCRLICVCSKAAVYVCVCVLCCVRVCGCTRVCVCVRPLVLILRVRSHMGTHLVTYSACVVPWPPASRYVCACVCVCVCVCVSAMHAPVVMLVCCR